MVGANPLCWFTQHSLDRYLGVHWGTSKAWPCGNLGVSSIFPDLVIFSIVTCKYELVDIDIVVIGCAFEFWEVHKSSIDFPLCS